MELNDFLTAGVPFGTPIDLNPSTAKLQAKFTTSINPHKKVSTSILLVLKAKINTVYVQTFASWYFIRKIFTYNL